MVTMTKQDKLRDGLAKILWEINLPSHVPSWEDLKRDTHEQCEMEVTNTLIDAAHILQYLHENDVVMQVDYYNIGTGANYKLEPLI